MCYLGVSWLSNWDLYVWEQESERLLPHAHLFSSAAGCSPVWEVQAGWQTRVDAVAMRKESKASNVSSVHVRFCGRYLLEVGSVLLPRFLPTASVMVTFKRARVPLFGVRPGRGRPSGIFVPRRQPYTRTNKPHAYKWFKGWYEEFLSNLAHSSLFCHLPLVSPSALRRRRCCSLETSSQRSSPSRQSVSVDRPSSSRIQTTTPKSSSAQRKIGRGFARFPTSF